MSSGFWFQDPYGTIICATHITVCEKFLKRALQIEFSNGRIFQPQYRSVEERNVVYDEIIRILIGPGGILMHDKEEEDV